MISLNDLAIGKIGIIEQISLSNHTIRLLSIGFIPKKEVCVERKGFFNTPLYVIVDGNTIALTEEESKYIIVNEKN